MSEVRLKHIKIKLAILAMSFGAVPALGSELVVTANRIETAAEKLGSTVTVITAEEIDRRQARTAVDVLRDVPGLAISSMGGAGRTTVVRIRGGESYHTKVIIDGVDMTDQSTGQPAYDFGHLLAADIERIEVVRGPQSLLYGGDAVSGVINIITKKGKGEPKVTGLIEGGNLHTYTGSAGVSGSTDRVSYAFNAARFETDGISAADRRNGNPERDPYWNNTFSGRLGVRLTDTWGIEASGRFMRSKVDFDDWTTRAVDDTDQMVKTERSGRLGTDFSLFDGRFKNLVAYSDLSVKRDINNGEMFWGEKFEFYDSRTKKLEYQGTLSLATDHTLVFGAETKKDQTKQSDLSVDVRNNGYFLDYQLSPIDSLFLTVGGRLDDHQRYGTNTTWRSTAAYLVDSTQTRFHGSYGTGFRAPSLYELFHPFWGNTDLNPEKSRGWDIGIEQTLLKGQAMIDVTWFNTRVRDLIRWEGGRYLNVASTRAQGVEVTAHWDIVEDWRVRGSYTYTDSRNNLTGQELAQRPKHQGSVGVSWTPIRNLTTDATLRAVGRQYDNVANRYLGGFATVDLAVNYDITPWARVFGRLENLADKKYQEIYSYGMPGRMGFVGVRVTF